MDYKDYYATLKVKKDVPQEEIQKAYRKLARKYHPDVNKSPDSETRFKEIGEAYEVLRDPEKRQKYDQFGAAWKNAHQPGGSVPPGWAGFDFGNVGDMGGMGGSGTRFEFSGTGAEGFSSFFEMLFGSGGPGARRAAGAPRGRRGTGGFPDFGDFGGGGVGGPRPGADVEAVLTLTLEEAIRGGSREFSFVDPNTGQRKNLQVKIPPAVRSGQRIRLAGRGLHGEDGGEPGDLFLKIEVLPDPRFRVEGSDLYAPLPVAPWEAALGGEAQVETPEGPVRVKIPAGSSSGRKIRLRGRGLARQGREAAGQRERGDLFAEIRVVIPEQLSERERELFEQLAQESHFRARG
ncbi:MAG TPA: DnaJ C-terminal domain-containing protein [Thermoanaerobaculia bacterium]|nr:DnaJ C-terminal domain-containing protein [Thermoanaerobaculia bacterium]